MNGDDWTKLLDDQWELVKGLHDVRMDSLLYGENPTGTYNEAARRFDSELNRYHRLQLRYESEQRLQEIREVGDMIRERMMDLWSGKRFYEPYLDFDRDPQPSTSTSGTHEPYIDMAFDGEAFVPAYEQPSMSYQGGVSGLPLDEIPALDAERVPALPYGGEESDYRYR